MLKIFQGKEKSPNYRLVAPADGKLQTITVKEEVRQSGQDGGMEVWLTKSLDKED